MIPLFKVRMADEAPRYVQKVLDSGYVGEGERVKQFENEFAKLVGAKEVKPLMVNSCTSALSLAYHLLNLGPGSSIISSSQTCAASNMPLLHRGVKIVWADVDKYTGLIDVIDVAKKIDSTTKAIIAVDWAGQLPDYELLRELGIPIVEDAAHSLLATNRGWQTTKDNIGYIAWSFQAIKHLNTGDGGCLLVPPEQYERAKKLRWFGLDRDKGGFRADQDIAEAGFKYASNDIAAAIGLANIKDVRLAVEAHQNNAKFFNQVFKDLVKVYVPVLENYTEPSWWFYPILLLDGKYMEFISFMAEKGIQTGKPHRRNDRLSCFKASNAILPNTAFYDSHYCAIPCGSWLSVEDLHKIADAIIEWDKK